MDKRIRLRGGESGSKKKMGQFVPKEVWNKQKMDGRYMKCGRSNYQARDCEALLTAKTHPLLNNTNQEPIQGKRKFDSGHLKIMELSSEEDLGNK